jgi:hypothetical protein
LIDFLVSGGVRKDMYNLLPRQIQSKHGFEGCLASLDLNGESPDTTLDALVPSPLVVPGCEGSYLPLLCSKIDNINHGERANHVE